MVLKRIEDELTHSVILVRKTSLSDVTFLFGHIYESFPGDVLRRRHKVISMFATNKNVRKTYLDPNKMSFGRRGYIAGWGRFILIFNNV